MQGSGHDLYAFFPFLFLHVILDAICASNVNNAKHYDTEYKDAPTSPVSMVEAFFHLMQENPESPADGHLNLVGFLHERGAPSYSVGGHVQNDRIDERRLYTYTNTFYSCVVCQVPLLRQGFGRDSCHMLPSRELYPCSRSPGRRRWYT